MKPGRRLPAHTEAEDAFIGALMLRGKLDDAARRITELDLYQPRAQSVFRAMRILDERGEPLEVIGLDAQLRRTGESELVGGIEGIARFDRHATAIASGHYVDLILEAAQARRVIEFGERIAHDMIKGVDDPATYLAQRQAELSTLAELGVSDVQTWTGGRVLQDMMLEKIAEATGNSRGVSTGFPRLDSMLTGRGPRPGQLVVLGGRPKMGKTSLALSMTRSAMFDRVAGWPIRWKLRERPTPVLWACDEMRAVEIMERIFNDVGGFHAQQLASPTSKWISHNMDKLGEAGRLIGASPLEFVRDKDTHYLDRIVDAARHWRARHPITGKDSEGRPKREPAILVVDYLQRLADLPGISKHAGVTERVGAKVKLCKTIAQELDIVVILLSQLNRSLETRPNKRPMAADFRDSGEIEQEADALLACYRDIEYDENKAAIENQISEFTGRSGVMPDELEVLLAHFADGYQLMTAEAKAIRDRCTLTEGAMRDLLLAKQRLSETEIIVIANRRGPNGVVKADFIGQHYRFIPRGEDLT